MVNWSEKLLLNTEIFSTDRWNNACDIILSRRSLSQHFIGHAICEIVARRSIVVKLGLHGTKLLTSFWWNIVVMKYEPPAGPFTFHIETGTNPIKRVGFNEHKLTWNIIKFSMKVCPWVSPAERFKSRFPYCPTFSTRCSRFATN